MGSIVRNQTESVPSSALGISLAALAVPVAGAWGGLEIPENYQALLWLLLLVPAFLLAYHRGWKGVATALAAGMATLSLTQVALIWTGRGVPDLLLGVVVAYVGIALAFGWMANTFRSELTRAQDLAFEDSLTRLPNRRYAEDFLEEAFAAAERGRRLVVVFFDLDAFKAYNDRYGHPSGDEALKAFGALLSEETRAMDLSARIGGEEFVTVLTDLDVEGAVAFAGRIQSEMVRDSTFEGKLTVSAGIACYEPSMPSSDDLLSAADRALYRAKRAGRARIRIFGEGDESDDARDAGPAPSRAASV